MSSGSIQNLAKTRQFAEDGDCDSQLRLGYAYLVGDVFDQDELEAERWFRLAADQGDPDAQYVLSKLGLGYGKCEPNPAQSIELLHQAAAQGHTRAQVSLGVHYENRDGGRDPDIAQAVHWFTQAAESGDPMAQAALALLYRPARIYKTDVLQVDKEKSDYWRRRSAETARILAENGQSHAQCWLASCYMTGEGVERDWDKAIHWARQAAIRGSYRAIDLLTTLYKGKARESGEHVGHDHAIYKSDAMKFTDEYLDRQKGRFRLTMNIDFFDW